MQNMKEIAALVNISCHENMYISVLRLVLQLKKTHALYRKQHDGHFISD